MLTVFIFLICFSLFKNVNHNVSWNARIRPSSYMCEQRNLRELEVSLQDHWSGIGYRNVTKSCICPIIRHFRNHFSNQKRFFKRLESFLFLRIVSYLCNVHFWLFSDRITIIFDFSCFGVSEIWTISGISSGKPPPPRKPPPLLSESQIWSKRVFRGIRPENGYFGGSRSPKRVFRGFEILKKGISGARRLRRR